MVKAEELDVKVSKKSNGINATFCMKDSNGDVLAEIEYGFEEIAQLSSGLIQALSSIRINEHRQLVRTATGLDLDGN